MPFLALTATATERVRQDIVEQLRLDRPQLFVASFNRANLSYGVLPKTKDTFSTLAQLLQKHKGESAIIYCAARRETENLAARLRADGFNAQPYHAGLTTACGAHAGAVHWRRRLDHRGDHRFRHGHRQAQYPPACPL